MGEDPVKADPRRIQFRGVGRVSTKVACIHPAVQVCCAGWATSPSASNHRISTIMEIKASRDLFRVLRALPENAVFSSTPVLSYSCKHTPTASYLNHRLTRFHGLRRATLLLHLGTHRSGSGGLAHLYVLCKGGGDNIGNRERRIPKQTDWAPA
jgi:hypothetical protein